jgi:hypothetical protein
MESAAGFTDKLLVDFEQRLGQKTALISVSLDPSFNLIRLTYDLTEGKRHDQIQSQ